MRLDGKVALIVGGGADGPPNPGETIAIGNGRATAVSCAREGAAVMVADISPDAAQATVDLIRAESGRAEAVVCDVGEPDDCRAAVAATVEAFDALHLLVNVAGIADKQTIHDVDVDVFDRCYRVNLLSNVLTMKYAVPEMAEAGGGAIVNVSSISALRNGGGIAYETTKAAQLALSRSVAVSLGGQGIRVNAVVLGTIDTAMVRRDSTPEQRAKRLDRIPMGRLGDPWEVASSIVFLLSDDAGFITGTELLIDGGSFRAAP